MGSSTTWWFTAFWRQNSVSRRRAEQNSGITRQYSGPRRRVSFSWFQSRRGAGSATDRPHVMPRRKYTRRKGEYISNEILRNEHLDWLYYQDCHFLGCSYGS